jgi:hypothetical protein
MKEHKDWIQIGIAVYVAGIIAYLVVAHTGLKAGQIKPEIVYTAFLSIFATKIVDFAYKAITKRPDKP